MVVMSLGSNCCITWWIRYYKLSEYALPFDWSAFTIQNLIDVLENNFDNFHESLNIYCISDKHHILNLDTDINLEKKPSAIIKNKYNFRFAHEVLKTDELDKFKISISNRIDRYIELCKTNKETITYVRIELKKITESYIKHLHKLIKLLDSFNENYIIKLIIHEKSIPFNISKIQIFYFQEFSSDWKMSELNWKTILTSSTIL
jgi:hypothetical protein